VTHDILLDCLLGELDNTWVAGHAAFSAAAGAMTSARVIARRWRRVGGWNPAAFQAKAVR